MRGWSVQRIADDLDSHDRIRRAAARLVGLSHPHLVAMRGVVSVDGAVVLVHDYVSGVGLDRVLADRGPLTEAAVVTLAVPLAQALALAEQLRGMGRLSDARSLCTRILAAQPNEAQAIHLLGLIAQNESQLPFGSDSFKQLIPPLCGCRCRATHPTFKIAAEIEFLRETPTMGVLAHRCSCEEEECSEDRCPCP